jgi:hypothetical protein
MGRVRLPVLQVASGSVIASATGFSDLESSGMAGRFNV